MVPALLVSRYGSFGALLLYPIMQEAPPSAGITLIFVVILLVSLLKRFYQIGERENEKLGLLLASLVTLFLVACSIKAFQAGAGELAVSMQLSCLNCTGSSRGHNVELNRGWNRAAIMSHHLRQSSSKIKTLTPLESK